MKQPQSHPNGYLSNCIARWQCLLLLLALVGAALPCRAATVTIYANDFESYTNVATSASDVSDADPVGREWVMNDDTALNPTNSGAGVQVINWLPNRSGGTNKSLLLHANSEAQVHFRNARSGTNYTLDFWSYAVREPTSSQNFYIVLRGEGSDINGDDFLAYQVNRATNSTVLRYYDGVGPGAGAWINTPANQTVNQWQHHRMVIDPNALTFTLYVDDMTTAVLTNIDLSRSEVAVPAMLRIWNEGNSADDGYFAIDDLSFTVEGSTDLSSTFVEGFEGYPARTSATDDADPQGPWVTTEVGGTGQGRLRVPSKAQVVDATVTAPHSGTKCLKIEGGQRAGVSFAWGTPPQSDVQITWWAKVPAFDSSYAVSGQTEFNYLRMSLYGAEDDNCVAGDDALLGYGIRNATVGTSNSLTYWITNWLDSGVRFTPDTWTEYRLTTRTAAGNYTIVKNPSSASPEMVADSRPMIGSASLWSPVFMAGWSSSNGTNHPPVYVDDIEIKSLVAPPMPPTYTVQFDDNRFTNVTVMQLAGPIGSVAVDPRDNSTILFTVDLDNGDGAIYQATKVASGNWAVDPKPLVSGLSNPSGMTIGADGTLWWVHDFTMALMRLKAPWSANTPERIIADFGVTNPDGTFVDDDPIDVCLGPASFNGGLAAPGTVVIADRGLDGDANNAVVLVDPATTQLNQTNYQRYLFPPNPLGLGAKNLQAITALPASGEVVTLNADGQVTAINADGAFRSFWPTFYSDPLTPIAPAAIATDPVTGRLWIADDAMHQVWSVPADGPGADIKEFSFPLLDTARTNWFIDFHDPGMTFSTNGAILVVSDTSTANGGGRLLIFHNESYTPVPFSIIGGGPTPQGARIVWNPAGAATYSVERSTTLLPGSWSVIVSNLPATTTEYTDIDAPAGGAFYRVKATH